MEEDTIMSNTKPKQRTTIFCGENTSQVYMDAMLTLLEKGEKCSPRGKEILELRPVILEYHNPLNRVTFVKGRQINPFFQLAEAFWIISGRSDVKWLTDYNRNMASFSDDGEYFNAPYGERLRYWNKSDANKFIMNPLDQLLDVYRKIKADPDTRQAVAVIYNPIFDNFNNDTVDRPCNLILTFKLRDGELDLQVYNRSNDLHWGTFGANLCQFATIQEMVAGWLGVKVGTYYQNTDSLHIYTDAYGAKETDKILAAYGVDRNADDMMPCFLKVDHFEVTDEPRMSSSFETTQRIIAHYHSALDDLFRQDITYSEEGKPVFDQLIKLINTCPDAYWRNTFFAMLTYQAHRRDKANLVIEGMSHMADSSWRISCLRFLSKKYAEVEGFKELYAHMPQDVQDYINRKGE